MDHLTELLLTWPNFWTWLSCYMVFALFLGLGSLFALDTKIEAVRPALGFSVFMIGLYLPIFFPRAISFDLLLILAILASLAGFWRTLRQNSGALSMWGMLLLLSLPITFLFSARGEFGWDGYTTWLPAAKFIYLNHGFPRIDQPSFAGIVDYPFGVPVQHALASIFAGTFQDNATTVMNGLWAWTLLAWFVDRSAKLGRQVRLSVLAIPVIYLWQQCLGETMPGNPNGDAFLSVIVTHLGLFILSTYFNPITKNSNAKLYRATLVILIAASLPLIKEAGSVFAVLLFAAIVLIHFVTRPSFKLLPWTLIGTAASVFVIGLLQRAIWKIYIHSNEFNVTIKAGTVTSWKWWLSDKVIWGMIEQTNHRPFWILYPAILLLTIRFLRTVDVNECVGRQTNFQNWDIGFSIKVSFLASLLWASLLFLIYIASFSVYEASYAASFARYIAPLGVLGGAVFWITVHSYLVGQGFLGAKSFNAVAIALYVSLIVVILALFASGRLDVNAQTKISKKAVAALEMQSGQGRRVYVVEDAGDCLTGAKIRYYSAGKFSVVGNNCNFGSSETPENLMKRLRAGEFEFLAFFSGHENWNSLIVDINKGPRIVTIDNGEVRESFFP